MDQTNAMYPTNSMDPTKTVDLANPKNPKDPMDPTNPKDLMIQHINRSNGSDRQNEFEGIDRSNKSTGLNKYTGFAADGGDLPRLQMTYSEINFMKMMSC